MNAHIRDNFIYLNDDRIVYAQRTTDTGAITTAQTTVLSAPSYTPISSGRLLKITGRWRGLNGSVANDIFAIRLTDFGVAQLNEINVQLTSTNGVAGGTIVTYVANPSVTAHTYTIAADRVLGSGSMIVQANAAYPCQIIVEDIGAT
jgi:hypothetical protein